MGRQCLLSCTGKVVALTSGTKLGFASQLKQGGSAAEAPRRVLNIKAGQNATQPLLAAEISPPSCCG